MNSSSVVLAVRERSDNPMIKDCSCLKNTGNGATMERLGNSRLSMTSTFLYAGEGVATSYSPLKLCGSSYSLRRPRLALSLNARTVTRNY